MEPASPGGMPTPSGAGERATERRDARVDPAFFAPAHGGRRSGRLVCQPRAAGGTPAVPGDRDAANASERGLRGRRGGAALALELAAEIRVDEAVEIAVEHGVRVADLHG